jgi:alkylhydroperoxidase family enzyme
MPRITLIHQPADYPGTPDAETRAELAALFATLFPGAPVPAFDAAHTGMAIAAHNPKLALKLAQLSGFIAGELPWSQQKLLRELAIQTLNLHFRSLYSFTARTPTALACGITAAQLDDLLHWQLSPLFDADQRLIIEYAKATAAGAVTDDLSARMVARFGEKGTVECTALIAFWGFWAMLLAATYG